MSSMLEQAIIDAEELREAARKNAEETVVEKYQDQIREAVEKILEQDEMEEFGAMDDFGEIEGVDYHFISRKDFENKIKCGVFLEWAKIHKQYYGTAFDTVECHRKNGEDVIIEIDVQGARSLRGINYKAIFIFMLPPSLEELGIRLNKRDTESESNIKERMEVGKKEIKQLDLYDYILTNFEIEETSENLLSIIRAEHCRKELYQPTSPDLSDLFKNGANT